jgi:protein-disulfide isomerase
VGIVEFSDFQCPFCRRFHEQTLPAIRKRYIDPGKVRYSYRDFPLDGHGQAQQAAAAARCAGRQGAYWQMQVALFERQRELGPPLYPVLATGLKLDPRAFKACLSGRQEIARVRADGLYGQGLQVDSTPHFFIGKLSGNRLLSPISVIGASPFERFQAVIEDLLRP